MTHKLKFLRPCKCAWCNEMREPGVEPGSLAAPDPKSSNQPHAPESTGQQRAIAHRSAPEGTGAVQHPVQHAESPVLIAATLVKGGTDRWCAECGRAISSAWPLRLTYRQGRSVFVSWVHPHVAEDEGQHACAPDHDLVKAAIR